MPVGEAPSAVRVLGLRLAEQGAEATLDKAIGWFQEEDQIRSLASFDKFTVALQLSPEASRIQSTDGLERLAVAWVRRSVASKDPTELWAAFWHEVCDPEWHYVSMANLRNFEADETEIAFPDGLSIRSRSLSGLATSTGWSPELLQQTVGADWNTGFGGSGSYVVVHEGHTPNSGQFPPDNFSNAGTAIGRLVLAMRLNAFGDISTGSVFSKRRTGFPMSPGIVSTGPSPNAGFGSSMLFVAMRDGPAVESLYRGLTAFETTRTAKVEALGVALARFDASYSRQWVSHTDRVLDDMIGLEALVGDLGAELSYSIAIRTSGLLAPTDAKRVSLFKLLRSFYAARSVIVHGRTLKPAQEELIAREPELRDVLRRLLRGYLRLRAARGYSSDEQFRDTLDVVLLDRKEREKLRAAMSEGETAPADPSSGRITPQWSDQPRSQATVIAGDQTITDDRLVRE